MYDINTIENQKIYLSGAFIEGLQGFNTTWNYPAEDAVSLGFSTPFGVYQEGPLEGDITLNRLIVSSGDPLTGFFKGGISGHLRYGEDKTYIFDKGYISNYSCVCEVDELPQLDATLRTFGTVVGASGSSAIQPGPETSVPTNIFLPNQGDIGLDITNYNNSDPVLDLTTDTVESFEYNIDIEWDPIYGLGAQIPQTYMNKAPVVEVIIRINLNENISPDFHTQACSPTLKDLTLNIFECGDVCEEASERTIIRRFKIPCARLISYNNISAELGNLIGEFVFQSTSSSVQELHSLVGPPG